MKIRKIDLNPDEVRCPKCDNLLVLEVGDIFEGRMRDYDELVDCHCVRCIQCKIVFAITNPALIKQFFSKEKEVLRAKIKSDLDTAVSYYDSGRVTETMALCEDIVESIKRLKGK